MLPLERAATATNRFLHPPVKPSSPEPTVLLKDAKDQFELVTSAFPNAHLSSEVKSHSDKVQDLEQTRQWRNANLGLKPGQSTALYLVMSFLNRQKALEFLKMLADRPNILGATFKPGERVTVGPVQADPKFPVISTSTHQIAPNSAHVIHEITLTHSKK